MASASRIACFQCEESDYSFDHFKNGWRLRSGEFAQLCQSCASVYEGGRFCETFHSNDDGWRDCESCGKLVHCGCIVSFNAYLLLDFGGVICMECSRINFMLARNRCLALEPQLLLGSHQDMFKQNMIEPQYWPRVTDAELHEISRPSDSIVTPLFEKLLSSSDADHKLSRLILPKRCAEAFFPDISEPHGLPIKIRDTEGKEWEVNFRCWINAGSKMYIMEGLRELMMSKGWQAGDTVTFFKLEPGGSLVMGLRKTSIFQPPNEDHDGAVYKKNSMSHPDVYLFAYSHQPY